MTSGLLNGTAPAMDGAIDPRKLALIASSGNARSQHGIADYAVAAGVSAAVATGFVVYSGAVAHWFLLPLLACATIVGSDAVRWVRGAYDTFDPKGLIGLFGFHFFFLAPLLFVAGRRDDRAAGADELAPLARTDGGAEQHRSVAVQDRCALGFAW